MIVDDDGETLKVPLFENVKQLQDRFGEDAEYLGKQDYYLDPTSVRELKRELEDEIAMISVKLKYAGKTQHFPDAVGACLLEGRKRILTSGLYEVRYFKRK